MRWWRGHGLLLGLAVALTAAAAHADVTGSYDATMVPKKGPQAIVAVSLVETAGSVIGTVAMNLDDASASWLFPATGRARGPQVLLTGVDAATGARFTFRGKLKGTDLAGKGKVKAPGRKVAAKVTFVRRQTEPPVNPPEHCDSTFFEGQVMGRVLTVCAACHVPGGTAAATTFRVTMSDPIATQDSVALHIDTATPAQSRILLKPTGQLPHGGGVRFTTDSEEYGILAQWAELVAAGQQCNAPGDKAMTPLAPGELLVRAAMDLRGRRPAPAELDAVASDPSRYAALVEEWLHSPEFLERVKDAYDEALLVRREDDRDESRDETSAIYGEALELIAWIVANDRPFTEIGTADYTVANQLFQRDARRMPYPMEPVTGDAWQPTHYTDGRPHAGLLSTSAFYEVWDTNNTNVNRRRANRWSIVFHCYNFLDTPVDVTRDVDNNDAGAVLSAVTTRSDCKACHDRLDPMASFLFPMDDAYGIEDGATDVFFRGNAERWRTANMRPPAVYGTPGQDLRDLGRLLVAHPRFAECQTRRAFKMLFLRNPQTSAELVTAADIANRWATEDGYDFRSLVRRWMLSPVYTEQPTDGDPAWVRRPSPERLETLLADVTGFTWTRRAQDDENDADPNSDPPRDAPVPLLTTSTDGGYAIILGGIDGETVTARSHGLNASVLMLQRKLASLAAEWVMANDLALPDGSRKLLNGVVGDEQLPEDDAAVRAAIAGMARRLYGVQWAADDAQIDPLVTLYGRLWSDRSNAGDGYGAVPGTRAERAWRGVLVAMLRSPRLLLY